MSGLIRLRLEPRTAIMAMAEVVWEDQPGTWRGAFAKIEDTSRSGACLRIPTAIAVGARLKIKWHKEQFSGIAKYCRREGGEFILGIQRESSEAQARTLEIVNKATAKTSATTAPKMQEIFTKPLAPPVANMPNAVARLEIEEIKAPRVSSRPGLAPLKAIAVPVPVPVPVDMSARGTAFPVPVPIPPPIPAPPIAPPAPMPTPVSAVRLSLPLATPAAAIPVARPAPSAVTQKVAEEAPAAGHGKPAGDLNLLRFQEPATNRPNELLAQGPSQGPERNLVFNKLLHLGGGPGRNQPKASDGNSNNSKGKPNVMDPKPPPENLPNSNARAPARAPTPAVHKGRLLPLQDIYLAVGIMSSRLGYTIDTVSTMLDSEHLRGLSSEVKRASVLMALEAAGIPVDELLRDGALRLDALNEYEAGERKHFEEYEARKAQESAQIQAEVERMTAHCMGRIQNNLGEVTSAKDAFDDWNAKKQKEAQRISDAVSLFSKASASDPLRDSQGALEEVGAESKR